MKLKAIIKQLSYIKMRYCLSIGYNRWHNSNLPFFWRVAVKSEVDPNYHIIEAMGCGWLFVYGCPKYLVGHFSPLSIAQPMLIAALFTLITCFYDHSLLRLDEYGTYCLLCVSVWAALFVTLFRAHASEQNQKHPNRVIDITKKEEDQ